MNSSGLRSQKKRQGLNTAINRRVLPKTGSFLVGSATTRFSGRVLLQSTLSSKTKQASTHKDGFNAQTKVTVMLPVSPPTTTSCLIITALYDSYRGHITPLQVQNGRKKILFGFTAQYSCDAATVC